MTRFYGVDCFGDCRPAFRRFWLKESMSLIRKQERIDRGIENDDEMYECIKDVYGEELAAQALYERKRARDELAEKMKNEMA